MHAQQVVASAGLQISLGRWDKIKTSDWCQVVEVLLNILIVFSLLFTGGQILQSFEVNFKYVKTYRFVKFGCRLCFYLSSHCTREGQRDFRDVPHLFATLNYTLLRLLENKKGIFFAWPSRQVLRGWIFYDNISGHMSRNVASIFHELFCDIISYCEWSICESYSKWWDGISS